AHDANRVRELLLRRKDGKDRALGERAVADLTPARTAHHAHFTDGERREVVVMHVALRVDGRERVDDLLVPARPERRDRHNLWLTAGEDGRAMRPRQNSDLDRQLADVLGA